MNEYSCRLMIRLEEAVTLTRIFLISYALNPPQSLPPRWTNCLFREYGLFIWASVTLEQPPIT